MNNDNHILNALENHLHDRKLIKKYKESESKIVGSGWEYRRWSLHDSDDLYVIKISNGIQSLEVTGFTEEEAYDKANKIIREENERLLHDLEQFHNFTLFQQLVTKDK